MEQTVPQSKNNNVQQYERSQQISEEAHLLVGSE
jgi:hypothetical protein